MAAKRIEGFDRLLAEQTEEDKVEFSATRTKFTDDEKKERKQARNQKIVAQRRHERHLSAAAKTLSAATATTNIMDPNQVPPSSDSRKRKDPPPQQSGLEEYLKTPSAKKGLSSDNLASATKLAQQHSANRQTNLAAKERLTGAAVAKIAELTLSKQEGLKAVRADLNNTYQQGVGAVLATMKDFNDAVQLTENADELEAQVVLATCKSASAKKTSAPLVTDSDTEEEWGVDLHQRVNSRPTSPFLFDGGVATMAHTPHPARAAAIRATLDTLHENDATDDATDDAEPKDDHHSTDEGPKQLFKTPKKLTLVLGRGLDTAQPEWVEVVMSSGVTGQQLSCIKSRLDKKTGKASFTGSLVFNDDCLAILLENGYVIPIYTIPKKGTFYGWKAAKESTTPVKFPGKVERIVGCGNNLVAFGSEGIFHCAYKGKGVYAEPTKLTQVDADVIGVGPETVFGFASTALKTDAAKLHTWPMPGCDGEPLVTTNKLSKKRVDVKPLSGSDFAYFLGVNKQGYALIYRLKKSSGKISRVRCLVFEMVFEFIFGFVLLSMIFFLVCLSDLLGCVFH